jgi:mannose-1-phosphate guanylyltransferase
VESNNKYVYSEISVTLCGIEELIVVIGNGKGLVCKKGSSQLLKKAVDEF